MKRTSADKLTRRPTLALLGVLLIAGLAVTVVLVGTGKRHHASPKTNDVTAWSPPGTRPLPDWRAAALVTPDPETVPANLGANRRVPSRAELAEFRATRNNQGQTVVQFNPLMRYVTGRPRIDDASTDQLIQWVSHKWGIPTDLIRAQMAMESRWRQSQLGDRRSVRLSAYERYPTFARIPETHDVYQSLGIAQVKWIPDGSVGAGSEPLRWQSTAFSLDYYAATIRYYYDGLCNWCGPGYRRGQAWNSVGAWFSPEP
ncbi:MAG: hypothetical protein ACXVRH_03275 [Thermoleophilaceae bacterium]